MEVSESQKTFAILNIPKGLKPFRYPLENGGYVDLYLRGKTALSREFSQDGIWLDAELCFSNFELSGSLTGKLAETYQRVGDIKSKMGDEFSLKANIFVVIMVILGGLGLFFAIGHVFIH